MIGSSNKNLANEKGGIYKFFETNQNQGNCNCLISTDSVDNVESTPWLTARTTNIFYPPPPRNSRGIRSSINIHH